MNVNYDEKNKIFIIKNNENAIMELEMNLNILKNNEYRKLANATTFGEYDINLLHNYAIQKYNYTKNKTDFMNEPLKKVFPIDTQMNNLMLLAHDYIIYKRC
jgi:hypothetical protein